MEVLGLDPAVVQQQAIVAISITLILFFLASPLVGWLVYRGSRRLLPELPTVDEVRQLLETPDTSTPLGLRDRAILELFYASALRNTELRMLRVGDVDLARLQVQVNHAKGGRQRVVPTSEEAAHWVGQYLERGRAFLLKGREHGFLFMSFRGRPFQVNRSQILL